MKFRTEDEVSDGCTILISELELIILKNLDIGLKTGRSDGSVINDLTGKIVARCEDEDTAKLVAASLNGVIALLAQRGEMREEIARLRAESRKHK